jgi:hypothetical protein
MNLVVENVGCPDAVGINVIAFPKLIPLAGALFKEKLRVKSSPEIELTFLIS